MATMIPPVINPATRSAAEVKMFSRFRDELPQDWTVIHSMDIADVPGKTWGEADFVLIGPPGVFSLEIKGGRVRYDSTTGKWIFTDRNGNENSKYEGPYEQADKAMHGLRNYVEDQFPDEFLPLFGFGVMTPDIEFNVDRPEVVKEILYDANNFEESLDSYVKRINKYWRSKIKNKPISTKTTVQRILKKLRGDLNLVPSLSVMVRNVEQQLIKLTDEQQMFIGGLSDNPRVVIRGAAGTGKTMCAVQEARKLSSQGKTILFTCFNRRLAKHLDNHINDPKIEVVNIHALMSNLIREAGHPFPETKTDKSWEKSVPEAAFNAIVELENMESYDALIVDETQDLKTVNYFEMVLDPLLKGGLAEGQWRMFIDKNQNIFGETGDDLNNVLKSYSPAEYQLTLNCRNTKQISNMTSILSGITGIQICKAEGPENNVSYYKTDAEARREIDRYINRLLSQGINTSQISIISPKKLENSILKNGLEKCPFDLSSPRPDEYLEDKKIGFYTVQSFKGLESDIVIIVDADDFDQTTTKVQNYVGASRAKIMLSVFIPESQKNNYTDLTIQWAAALSKQSD